MCVCVCVWEGGGGGGSSTVAYGWNKVQRWGLSVNGGRCGGRGRGGGGGEVVGRGVKL